MLSQKIWFNANTVLQDFIIVLSAIVEYAENKKKKIELIDYMLTLTQDIYSLTYACILHRPNSFDLPRAGHVDTAVNYISPERPHT